MLECFTLNVHYVYQVHIISPNLTTISQSMHSPRRCIYIYKEDQADQILGRRNSATRSSDEHYESLLIVFVLSTIGSTQTTWRSKIFAAAIQCEADFVGSVWQRFSVRRWS
ncbi:hypothetical protein IGI04_025436 [Brassica rapa subsp. trilocularis]|uniref:Uncharacterized protein n=1 Tax=Brassica rapa subsp. trilocularis TaxID=1813537 RepID=A0ABQ7KW88_BRACM|nr:hypothetical protein IGI04_025436 [Brassica rapa subsp. trilocularis]